MKKKLCIILLMSISITTFGQVIPKGTRFIGGDLKFNVTESKVKDVVQNNSFMIGITPSFTKFTKDNSAFTISLGYSVTTSGSKSAFNQDLLKASIHTISAGFYLSNYKMFNEKFGVSIRYGGEVGMLFTTTSLTVDSDDLLKGAVLDLNAGPGVIYLLNEKWAIEGVTSLVNITSAYTQAGDQSSYTMGTNISLNPSVGIGFRYFLK
jgi:hypothetical protein